MTGMKSHLAVVSNSSKRAPSQAFSIVRQRGCYVTGPTPDERDRASAGGHQLCSGTAWENGAFQDDTFTRRPSC
jgi:hypothetical protein